MEKHCYRVIEEDTDDVVVSVGTEKEAMELMIFLSNLKNNHTYKIIKIIL